MLEVDVVIAEVGREVHTEADAHDEIDERDAVQDNVPDGHEAQTANKGAHYAQDGRYCGEGVRKEDDGDSDYDDAGD